MGQKPTIKEGKCECIIAPMGAQGLEGFVEGEQYKHEIVELSGGDKYVRVYHHTYPDDPRPYYETCGWGTFTRHFKPVKV